jgi:hypothetical protein
MTIAEQPISKQKKINQIFAKIAGIPDPKTGIAIPGSGIAEPGDLLFFIEHHDINPLSRETKSLKESIGKPLERLFRKWYGFDSEDFDYWHIAIFYRGKKRKNHQRMNLWMIHSHPPTIKGKGGIHIQHLSPSIFFNKFSSAKIRMEILQLKDICVNKRKQILNHALEKLGSNFDYFVLRHVKLTLAFGIPNFLHDQKLFSCQHLVTTAYSSAGIQFEHPFRSYPFYNICRYLGHPLGHPKNRVNLRYPYLMDHHIYRDSRFVLKAAVYQDIATGELYLETENLKKYSWDLGLREKYIAMKALVP